MKKIAIILSGGVGSRMKLDIPKQYIMVENKPIICYCLETFLRNPQIDYIIIGVADEWKDFVEEHISKLNSTKKILFAKPGETRQYSIYNAMNVAKDYGAGDGDTVIIHDAARPLVSNDLISRCILSCNAFDGVMPAIPCKDTVYLSEDGEVINALLNRSHLWCGQAPEAFSFLKYLEAHENTAREDLLKINGSTELAIKAGMNCHMIPGDPLNFKITTPEDLSNFKSIIRKK